MNLTISQNNLDPQTPNSEIIASLVIAFDRTNTPLIDLSNMAIDVVNEFRRIEITEIQKAIRNGALGKYGRTYKMSTQEVCIWIREYLKEKNKNLGI